MMGLGRVWKAVVGGEGGPAPAPGSTIPRDLAPPRPMAPEPWPAAEGGEDAAGDTRGAERFVPNRTATALTTAAGKRISARIINLSRTGVALEAELADLSPAEVTLVGSRPVLPGRRIALGIVFLFKKPLDPKLCGPDIVL